MFWRRSPSDLRNLGSRGRPNPRRAGFLKSQNSKFGRDSATILNFAALASPDRTTFPRPGRKMFAARGGEHFVAGVRKSCGPGYLIAKGCAFSELCIILYPTTKYTTLAPKFYIFSVFSPRICFCFVKQYCIAGIAAFFEILLLAVSKLILKRS